VPGRAASAVTVREDIQRRVAGAGGNTEGVLVASLSWSTPDDLDLHVAVPSGAEISFRHRKSDGGELDVDMCVQGGRSKMCGERPVENVVFADEAPMGRYKVYVQNFNFHLNYLPEHMQVSRMQERGKARAREEQELRLGRDRPVLFDVLVKVEGQFKLFRGLCTPKGKTHEQSNVPVFEFDYFPHSASEEDRFVTNFEASSNDPTCEEYRQRLLELGGGDSSRPQLEGGSRSGQLPAPGSAPLPGKSPSRSPSALRASASAAAQRPSGKASGASGGRAGRKAAKKRQAQEATHLAALSAVRAASRQTLLSKPPKVLRELLSDLGESCKGCMEKGELVDRLQQAAGVDIDDRGGSGSGGGGSGGRGGAEL